MELDHINIRTNDIETVKDELVFLLRLEAGDRPPLKREGYWLYGNGRPIVHLNSIIDDPGSVAGPIDHVAFKDTDFDGLIERLEQKQILYRHTVVPGSGVHQVFFDVTHDVTIEVDFDPDDVNVDK